MPLARKYGEAVFQEALLLGGAPVVGLGSGAVLARRTELRRGIRIVLVAGSWIFILVALGITYRLNLRLTEVATQLGVDKKTEKYVLEANKDCPENLKSLYIAFSMYTQDWDALPPSAGWMDNQDLVSKVQKNEWLHCPAVSNRRDEKFGYAYNASLAERKLNGKPLNEMADAAKTPLLYDSTLLAKGAQDAFATLPKPGRHGGRNNILYCDGHVEAVEPK
jgi:prepilin-type processing-associated H-X9-DG protein